MGLGETLVLYLTIGLAVSLALLASAGTTSRWARTFEALGAAIFWPLYLPVVLSARSAETPADSKAPPQPNAAPAADDEMSVGIAQVERELVAAFASLDGWAEHVLSRERDRLTELTAALGVQAARIREMDALARAVGVEPEAPLDSTDGGGGGEALERFRQSQTARRQNLARLAAVRRAAYADLMATLAWIRELVSMIHLAKFTGAPAARAEELVAQIAAAVEGISCVASRDDPPFAGRQPTANRPPTREPAETPAA